MNIDQNDGQKKRRLDYEAPAIVYEGKITIRAGSPVNPADLGPPSPFEFSENN
jgi:hypothetical protein